MPWTVLYDEHCVLHLNPRDGKAGRNGARASAAGAGSELAINYGGEPVPVRAARYRTRFALPNGSKRTADAVAFTSLASDGDTFFVMALPSVWRKDPRSMPGEDIDAFASGVLAHEMTHTIHMVAIGSFMQELGKRHPMPESLDDDYLQGIFGEDRDYVADYEREIALYARAVATGDDAEARALARQALAASAERRERYFRGPHAYFLEAEPVFLNMEGVASWAAYVSTGSGMDPQAFAGRFWSQQQGLYLFLLLDRFDREWKSRVFDARVPDPFAMLRAAVGGD
jgi:hypothetical protein